MYLRTIIYTLLFFSINVCSQSTKEKSFYQKLEELKTFSDKKIYVDSLLKVKSFSEIEKSYMHHSYANLLFKNNRIKECYYHLERAIEIRKNSGDLNSLKKSLFNLGFYYRKSDLIFKSINTFKELSELPIEDRLRMKSYSELTTLYSKIGDFEKSKRYFLKSTEYYVSKKDYRNLYKNYMRISKVYASIDDSENYIEIIDNLKKADSIGEFTQIEKNDESLINLRLGNVYVKIKDKEKAIYHYKKALQISQQLNDSLSVSMLNNNIGDLYLNDELYSKAKNMLEASLQFAGRDSESRALAYSTIASFHSKQNEFNKAKFFFEKAIQLLTGIEIATQFENPELETLFTHPNKLLVLDLVSQKANYWQTRYKHERNKEYLNHALLDYQLADQLLDVIRFESSEKTSKLFWREKAANLYINAVEVCYMLNDVGQAYFFMEKNKALLLLEELSHQKAQVLSKLPQELIERDFTFKQNIIHAEESNTPNKIDSVFELKKSYEQFKDSIASNYPEYSTLRKNLPILSLQNHKGQFIKKGTVSLQYITGNKATFGIVVTNNGSHLFKINDELSLKREIINITKQLQSPFETQAELDEYVVSANIIFNQLLPKDVYNKIKGKRIVVSADGIIQNVPFDALISNKQRPDSFLIKTNEFTYVYSFSYLNLNNEKSRNPKHKFLGMAPENFKDDALGSLANSVEEVNHINSIFSDKVFVNSEATKLNFISNFQNYKMIHLATHSGASNTENPWLAFSDDKMNLNEIYATKNYADLVVLSACKTSQGEMKSGEGVMSLARGFFFSGTNSVISTLWNINDKSTREIMHGFYVNLKKGMSKSKALHESKRTYLSTHDGTLASPYYWGSYVLIGDMNAISLNDSFDWVNISILIFSTALLLFIAYNRFKK